MFRFGVLGASYFALNRMIPAMQAAEGATVAAIASRDGEKAANAARALGIPRAYGSYEALLADPEIDAIYNPLPNHLHVSWSERAAAARKHVLCEKPIALDASEARRLLAARDDNGVLIGEAAMVRVHPRWLAVRELIRAGQLGEVSGFMGSFCYRLQARDNVRYDPTMGGGVLLDVGFYPVTLSRFCFGAEPLSVVAQLERDPDAGVDVLSSAILRFARGHALFTTGMHLAPQQRVQIFGSKGHIDVEHAFNPAPDRPSRLLVETSPLLETPAAELMEFAPVDQYSLLVEQFARAALSGGPAPVPLEESIANLVVLDALRRSAESGRWVSV
jgi:predicted dehydrogenase